MSRILIVSFSPIDRDPRVLRQIGELRDRHALTVAGFGPITVPGVEPVNVQPAIALTRGDKARLAALLVAGRSERYYWNEQEHVRQLVGQLTGRSFDLVLANDVDSLPVAFRLAQRAPVVADLHEYALNEARGAKARVRSLFNRWALREYLPGVAGVSTVADGIANAYAQHLRIPRPVVIPNAPRFEDLAAHPVDPDCIHLVHHGACSPERGLDRLVLMTGHLDDRFKLHLMLIGGDSAYAQRLRSLAANNRRVHFHPPVATVDIAKTINRFDMGIHVLPPHSFNDLHALPNKYFEFVQARLGVITGPSPEMASLTAQHGLGLVVEGRTPSELAEEVGTLTAARVRSFKAASNVASRSLCWEAYAPRLRALVDAALEGK